jgi:hypothetical protein
MALLAEAGVHTWVFGGWAEEMRGLVPPRDHQDLDLLCPVSDLTSLDEFLASERVPEQLLKRFPHKRAFDLDSVCVELILVQRDDQGYFTNFWGSIRYDWPADVFDGTVNDLHVVSSTALIDFRKTYSERRLTKQSR